MEQVNEYIVISPSLINGDKEHYHMQAQPRIIRLSEAPGYCGMGRTMFDKRIRPLIDIELQDGPGYVAFDRYDLDAAIDLFKQMNGKAKDDQQNKIEIQPKPKEIKACKPNAVDYSSTKSRASGVSTKESKATEESISDYRQALKKKLN